MFNRNRGSKKLRFPLDRRPLRDDTGMTAGGKIGAFETASGRLPPTNARVARHSWWDWGSRSNLEVRRRRTERLDISRKA